MVRLARRLRRCEDRSGGAKLLGRPGGGGDRRHARHLASMRCFFSRGSMLPIATMTMSHMENLNRAINDGIIDAPACFAAV